MKVVHDFAQVHYHIPLYASREIIPMTDTLKEMFLNLPALVIISKQYDGIFV